MINLLPLASSYLFSCCWRVQNMIRGWLVLFFLIPICLLLCLCFSLFSFWDFNPLSLSLPVLFWKEGSCHDDLVFRMSWRRSSWADPLHSTPIWSVFCHYPFFLFPSAWSDWLDSLVAHPYPLALLVFLSPYLTYIPFINFEDLCILMFFPPYMSCRVQVEET